MNNRVELNEQQKTGTTLAYCVSKLQNIGGLLETKYKNYENAKDLFGPVAVGFLLDHFGNGANYYQKKHEQNC